MLERLVPEELPMRLAACSGRLVGAGSCQAFLRAHSGWLHAGSVSYAWDFGPTLGLHLALNHDGRRAGTLHPGLHGWEARNVDLRTPIMLPDALPNNLISVWQPTGRQVISMPVLACDWRASNCTGRARIEFIDLTIGQPGHDPVGSYLLELDAPGKNRWSGKLSTLSGPLMLDGRVEKSPGMEMRMVGRARPGPGVSDGVRRLLADIARREDSDTFAYSFPQ